MSKALSVSDAEVRRGLLGKPWNDRLASRYFMDFGQILSLLPPPPARLLDLGVGPGWTSIFLARCGYSVVGLDIAPDMIRLAKENAPAGLALEFLCHDYEATLPRDGFDIVLIYAALHHATDEAAVIRNAYGALRSEGMFLTVEPGHGHSKTRDTLQAVARFGTTERDMEFNRQLLPMRRAGFREVRQYLRLACLPVMPVNRDASARQLAHMLNLAFNTITRGFTSIVVALK